MTCAASFQQNWMTVFQFHKLGVDGQSWQRIELENGPRVQPHIAGFHAHLSKMLQHKRLVLGRSGENVVAIVLRRLASVSTKLIIVWKHLETTLCHGQVHMRSRLTLRMLRELHKPLLFGAARPAKAPFWSKMQYPARKAELTP